MLVCFSVKNGEVLSVEYWLVFATVAVFRIDSTLLKADTASVECFTVLNRFASISVLFQLTTQYAVWDRIRDLAELKKWQRTNLALLIVDLLVKRSIGITVLKVLKFQPILGLFCTIAFKAPAVGLGREEREQRLSKYRYLESG